MSAKAVIFYLSITLSGFLVYALSLATFIPAWGSGAGKLQLLAEGGVMKNTDAEGLVSHR